MSAFPAIFLAANGTSLPLLLDLTPLPAIYLPSANYSIGLIGTLSSGGSLTWTVQVTADQKPSAAGFWNNHDVLSSQTASANSNIFYPCTALRLVVTNYVSGSINLGIARWP